MMTDKELKELVASLAKGQEALQAAQAETNRQLNRRIKELGKQIGGLGNKFGSFTEGLFFPSLEKILRKKFKTSVVAQRVGAGKGEDEIEIDLLGYTNGTQNTAVVVEIKSHLDEEGIQQLLENLKKLPLALPEHAHKHRYGLLAVVDAPKDLINRAHKLGLYVAQIGEETASLKESKNFQPRDFSK